MLKSINIHTHTHKENKNGFEEFNRFYFVYYFVVTFICVTKNDKNSLKYWKIKGKSNLFGFVQFKLNYSRRSPVEIAIIHFG